MYYPKAVLRLNGSVVGPDSSLYVFINSLFRYEYRHWQNFVIVWMEIMKMKRLTYCQKAH